MVLIPLPDGYTATVQGSSNGNPPGVVGGMYTNSATLWCRVTRGDFDTGWAQCWSKSSVKVVRMLKQADDAGSAWSIVTDTDWPSAPPTV